MWFIRTASLLQQSVQYTEEQRALIYQVCQHVLTAESLA